MGNLLKAGSRKGLNSSLVVWQCFVFFSLGGNGLELPGKTQRGRPDKTVGHDAKPETKA